MESKGEFTERLKQEGRWNAFVTRREDLKNEGTAAGEAWKLAAAEFPPLAAGGEQDERLLELVKAVPASKEAKEREIVSWVFENATTPLELLDTETIPSRGAIGLLVMVKSSPTHYSNFVNGIWAKLLPTRSQMEHTTPQGDDGRQLERLRLFEQSLASDPEETETEETDDAA